MAERRTWSIAVNFARQTDGRVTYSSTHWGPPKNEWPDYVKVEVEHLTEAMAHALEGSARNSSKDAG